MPKYLLAYHGGGMPESKAEQEAAMAAWGAWFGSLGDAIVDAGNPTGASRTLAADGSASDGGGPNPVSGYTLVSATDLNAAVSLAKGCPLLASGGTIGGAHTIVLSRRAAGGWAATGRPPAALGAGGEP